MAFVTKRSDIITNLEKFHGYLTSKKKEEQDFALDLIMNEDLIIIYKVDGENTFAPGRYVAFKGNSMKDYPNDAEVTDKEVTNTMTKVVGLPFTNAGTEEKFITYTKTISKKKARLDRVFWRLKDERGKNFNMVTKK